MADPLTGRILLAAGAGFLLAGASLAAWAARMLRARQRNEAAGRRTMGRVVENRAELDMENSRRVTPIVEFVGADGQARRIEGMWSTQQDHALGAEVPVYYDPLHPEQAGIAGQGRLGPILLLVLAASVAAFGIGLLVLAAVGVPAGE
jgi:hypothetical protein